MKVERETLITKPHEFRTLAGFAAAWGAAVATAFLVGCVFALFMGSDSLDLFKAAVHGNRDVLDVFLFVGGASALAAAVVAFLVVVFIAWPLYRASRKFQRVSLRQHILAGLGIALAVTGILWFLEYYFNPLESFSYWVEFVEIVIAGPAATMTFWVVTRPGHEREDPTHATQKHTRQRR